MFKLTKPQYKQSFYDQAYCNYDFNGRTQELELFYLCPVNIKPLGLVGLYLRLQFLMSFKFWPKHAQISESDFGKPQKQRNFTLT